MTRKLHVAIDCRIDHIKQGHGNSLLSLAKALSESDVSDQEYTFVVQDSLRGWLSPYIYGPCRLHGIRTPRIPGLRAAVRQIVPLRWAWRTVRDAVSPRPQMVPKAPVSDGYVESRGFDVVHFPTQSGFLTKLPSIYQPWDLQHLHYPQFFPNGEFACREALYRACCQQATFVCVQAQWTKQDLVTHYNVEEERVAVIPWGSIFEASNDPSEEETRRTFRKFGLPREFFFYPAVTWPHKNHEIILRALHLLKNEHGVIPHVVFTGSLTDRKRLLARLARELGVAGQLHFLGYVKAEELQVIARSATAMVFPSKFEGFGHPILEAFHARLPVLCSSATTLPEVARDGALYFDPDSAAELSALMTAILNKPELRESLIEKGAVVLSNYSMKNTVAAFQALYERTAALSLSGR